MKFDFDHFDAFADLLETDTKFMKKGFGGFGGLGSSYRTGGGKRRKNPRGGAGGMEDLLTMFMMPGMMSMGMGMKMGNKNKKKKK
jgi:hypothetical protein